MRNNDRSDLASAFDKAVPAQRTQLLPEGTYIVKLRAGAFGESSSGKRRWTATYEITKGPHKGRIVYEDFYLTDAAMPFSRSRLGAMGLAKYADIEHPPLEKPYELSIRHRTGNDQQVYADVYGTLPLAIGQDSDCQDDTTLPWLEDEEECPGCHTPDMDMDAGMEEDWGHRPGLDDNPVPDHMDEYGLKSYGSEYDFLDYDF